MKMAIIGGGISGLATAHLLCRDMDVTLYEANDYNLFMLYLDLGELEHVFDGHRPSMLPCPGCRAAMNWPPSLGLSEAPWPTTQGLKWAPPRPFRR
ncbi:hypothetical protein DSTSK_20130 [Desulforhabdus sp. TSK]|nr:NAD(P)-binding protein [Desulforhabdus sp. TSK]GKT08708.1 hypothetical protein DSTSK_20130 [Desulforhabdus sp. TSK]